MDKLLLGEYPLRVYYEDVDLGGIVYHSKYLNFCERARSELFFARGLSPVEGEYHFVARHLEADFVAPARFGDELIVHTSLQSKKRAALTLKQAVYDLKTMQKRFEMEIELVCLRGTKVSAIPEQMLAIFGGGG